MNRRTLLAIALGVALAACSGGDPERTLDVGGVVLAGPTCPVVQDPPDPSCNDRPVADALLAVLDTDGNLVAEVRSGTDGRFSIPLTAGEYVLEPQPVSGLLGTAERQQLSVLDASLDLVVVYDTGIRTPVPGGQAPP